MIPAIKVTGPRVQERLQALAAGGSTLRFGGMWTAVIVIQVALTVMCLTPGFGLTWETLALQSPRRVKEPS